MLVTRSYVLQEYVREIFYKFYTNYRSIQFLTFDIILTLKATYKRTLYTVILQTFFYNQFTRLYSRYVLLYSINTQLYYLLLDEVSAFLYIFYVVLVYKLALLYPPYLGRQAVTNSLRRYNKQLLRSLRQYKGIDTNNNKERYNTFVIRQSGYILVGTKGKRIIYKSFIKKVNK